MSGICFFKTSDLGALKTFYKERIGMQLWLDQGGCAIFRDDKFLIGFCDRGDVENQGMITFFYETRKEVEEMYEKLKDIATIEPRENMQYKIYQFFAQDPDGRVLEFQAFLHEIDWEFNR